MDVRDSFERFKRELDSLDHIQSKLIDYGLGPRRVTIQTFPGASSSEISNVERELKIVLPKSFKLFLANWNGAVMYKGKYIPGTKIFGTGDLVERNRIWVQQELRPEDRVPGLVLFADWNDGDFSVFDTSQVNAEGECPVLDGNHDFQPRQWEIICSTFDEWLFKFLDDQGGKFW